MIHVKPVPKLGNIVPKLKKRIWLSPVVINETGGALRFFLPGGTLKFLPPVVPVSIFGTMDSHFIFVTTGSTLPDCYFYGCKAILDKADQLDTIRTKEVTLQG